MATDPESIRVLPLDNEQGHPQVATCGSLIFFPIGRMHEDFLSQMKLALVCKTNAIRVVRVSLQSSYLRLLV